jgi:hypothetical protein
MPQSHTPANQRRAAVGDVARNTNQPLKKPNAADA